MVQLSCLWDARPGGRRPHSFLSSPSDRFPGWTNDSETNSLGKGLPQATPSRQLTTTEPELWPWRAWHTLRLHLRIAY